MSVFAVCVVCIEETYLVFYLESGPITIQMVLVCPQMYYFILYKKLKGERVLERRVRQLCKSPPYPTSCIVLLIKYPGHDTIYFAEDLSMKERRRKPFHTI